MKKEHMVLTKKNPSVSLGVTSQKISKFPINRCSISLVIKEMQSKTTVRYHSTPFKIDQ